MSLNVSFADLKHVTGVRMRMRMLLFFFIIHFKRIKHVTVLLKRYRRDCVLLYLRALFLCFKAVTAL